MQLTKKGRRVGTECREGEISDGRIEREINGRSIWVAEKSEVREVMMLLWFILWV
jgi:hypothetical protein